jgi:hypothetical protein
MFYDREARLLSLVLANLSHPSLSGSGHYTMKGGSAYSEQEC